MLNLQALNILLVKQVLPRNCERSRRWPEKTYLSTGRLSFVQPNRALIHSAFHESGSWRCKGQHCLCSVMLNQFGLDNILKLWLQLEDFVCGGDASDGCILLVMTAVRGLKRIERDLVIHFGIHQQIIAAFVLLYTPLGMGRLSCFYRPWTYNRVLDPHYTPGSLSSLGL